MQIPLDARLSHLFDLLCHFSGGLSLHIVVTEYISVTLSVQSCVSNLMLNMSLLVHIIAGLQVIRDHMLHCVFPLTSTAQVVC